jgi:DNA-binding transcriptional LysR family regulator
MLDIRRLRMLHEFAARGSIARTAEALGYTPSAVSQQLAVLEKEAGTPLLDRTARSAGLTDAGKRLAIHAERILAMVEAAEADLSAQAAQPSGRVVVTAFPSAAVAFAPALARSLRNCPCCCARQSLIRGCSWSGRARSRSRSSTTGRAACRPTWRPPTPGTAC